MKREYFTVTVYFHVNYFSEQTLVFHLQPLKLPQYNKVYTFPSLKSYITQLPNKKDTNPKPQNLADFWSNAKRHPSATAYASRNGGRKYLVLATSPRN